MEIAVNIVLAIPIFLFLSLRSREQREFETRLRHEMFLLGEQVGRSHGRRQVMSRVRVAMDSIGERDVMQARPK